MAHDVECVEDAMPLWRMARERGARELPSVYRGRQDAYRLFPAQCGAEECCVGLGALLPSSQISRL